MEEGLIIFDYVENKVLFDSGLPHGNLCVIDEHSAMEWWETLLKYLMLQERATKIRKWPNNHTWAHGDAAGYQKKTYLAATNLGDHFSEGINSELFRVEYCKINSGLGSFLRVYKDNKHFYTVWVYDK